MTALGSTTFHSFAPSDMSSSVTRTISSSGTISAGSGSNVFNGQADIEYLPSASSTGRRIFYLECTRAYTTESGSVDIRIYRTGGNSSAVDVTLYNDGSYQTISFASGENYKTVTINGQVHDGLRDSLDHHTDSTPPKPLDSYTLKPITIRGESWNLEASLTALRLVTLYLTLGCQRSTHFNRADISTTTQACRLTGHRQCLMDLSI